MRRAVVLSAALFACAGCARSAGPNEVHVRVTEDGFEPAIVTLARRPGATLIITRTTDATCATEAVFAEDGRKFALPLGEAVRIPITATAPETLHYACGMDMYKGRVVVR